MNHPQTDSIMMVKALTNETRTRDIDNLLNFWLETVAH